MGPVNSEESSLERLPHQNGFVERIPQTKSGVERSFLTNGHVKRTLQSDGQPGRLTKSNGRIDNNSLVNGHTDSPPHSNGDVDLPPQSNGHVKYKTPERTTKYFPNVNSENEVGKRKYSRQFDFSPQRRRQDVSPCRKRDIRSPGKAPTIKALQEKLKASSRFAFTSPTRNPSPSQSNVDQNKISTKPSQLSHEKQKATTTVASPDRCRSRSPSQRLPSTSQFKSPKKIQYSSPSRATIRPSVRSAIKAHNKQVCNSPVRNKLNTSVWVHHTGSIPKEHIPPTKEFNQKYLTTHNEEVDAIDESDTVDNDKMVVNDQHCSCDYSIPKAFSAHTCKIEVHAADDREERAWSNKLKDVSSIIRIPSESFHQDENNEASDKDSPENVNTQEREEVTTENMLSVQPAEMSLADFTLTNEQHIDTETPLDFSTKLKEADENIQIAFQNTPPPVFAYYIGSYWNLIN